MTTRRSVLISLAALPLAPACGGTLPPEALVPGVPDDDDDSGVADDDDSGVADDDDSSEPTPAPPPLFELQGNVDYDSFPAGIQTADALPDAILVALRSPEPDIVLRLGRVEPTGEVLLAFESDVLLVPNGLLSLELTALEPDTRYQLYVMDPTGARRSELGRFRTALAPGDRRTMRIAVTSCLGRVGAPWQSMRLVGEQDPDLCLLLGDTVYADGASTLTDYRGFWDEALETVGLQSMSLATSFVATWDDHEVANNWSWDQHGDLVAPALAAFRESIPQRAGPDPDRVYRSLRWGDAVELIVLDCRADRADGLYISEAQMAWLQDTLSTSTARFKLILNSVPIIDFTLWIGGLGADDRWQGYPAQRTELLTFIENAGLTGVLFLGGDLHLGAVARVSITGQPGDDLWEVMAGPGGSTINPMVLVPPVLTDQFDLLIAEWNTVLLDLDPQTGQVAVTFVNDAGDVIGERLLEP